MKIEKKLVPFTREHLHDKELVIRMLKWEDAYIRRPENQSLFKDATYRPYISLDLLKRFNRAALMEFGFSSTPADVALYRKIFKTYHKTATEYDKDVMEATHYFRGNRCVFYTEPHMKPGSMIPDVPLYELDGSETSLFEAMGAPRPRTLDSSKVPAPASPALVVFAGYSMT